MIPTTRAAMVAEVLRRAAASKRKIFGFTAGKAGCQEKPSRGVPVEWDWICVEGDREWTRLPAAAVKAKAG